ncbi:hypothetical protein AO067_10245 [Pseudomonas viridiflava ICMP 13104]|uniref:Uncharacterized protein n=1 Tax=Pseudomonas viridiflava ICMP 13104 TaxID=1198305 RepID=A0A0W0IC74_PSEVI|nr:hypothetical protein AO067_10245 [Pseudomonas viridiflava ICMP 13104]
MIRKITVWENNFLLIFSDAVRLYEAAVECENAGLNSVLAKSSVLSVNYAIEAAANSFLQSIKMTKVLQEKIDKFSTLDKFDFVLQWHTDHYLNSGDSDVQAVRSLIRNRNSMVHPTVTTRSISVETEVAQDGTIRHSAIQPEPRKGQDQKPKLLGDDPELYTHEDAKAALQVMTSFLNIFVYWWGVGFEVAETFLFQTWDGSINARQVMFRKDQITVLIRNDHFLNIQFMGIHGMFKGEEKPA